MLQTPAAPVLARENKKRKDFEDSISQSELSIKRGKVGKKERPPAERKSKNTAVYVTGLPSDTELDEIVERFSKCGVIEEDEEGEPKVKMYAKDDGTFSGEALVVFFKEDSVLLALSILDEAELRIGDLSSVMSLSKADFTHKETTGGAEEAKPRKTLDKKRITRRIGKMQKCVSHYFMGGVPLTEFLTGKLMNGTTKMALGLRSRLKKVLHL